MSYTTANSIDNTLSENETAAKYILDNLTESPRGQALAEEFLDDTEVYQSYKDGEIEDIDVKVKRADEGSYVKWAAEGQRLGIAVKNLSNADISSGDYQVEQYLNETFREGEDSNYAEKLLLSLNAEKKEEIASTVSKKLDSRGAHKEAQRFEKRWKGMARYEKALKEGDLGEAASIAKDNSLGEPYLSFASSMRELFESRYIDLSDEEEEPSGKEKVRNLIEQNLPEDYSSNEGPLDGIERI